MCVGGGGSGCCSPGWDGCETLPGRNSPPGGQCVKLHGAQTPCAAAVNEGKTPQEAELINNNMNQ